MRAFGRDALEAAAPRREAVALGDRLDRHEADVVAVAGVLGARIAEPDEQQHGSGHRGRARPGRVARPGPARRSAYFFSGAAAAAAGSRRCARRTGRHGGGGFGGSGGSSSGSSSSFGRGLHFFGVARRRHDGDQRDVAVLQHLHVRRQLDVAQVLRIVDLEAGDDRPRSACGMSSAGTSTAIVWVTMLTVPPRLMPGRLVGVDHVDRHAHAHHRAFAEAQEIHMDRIVHARDRAGSRAGSRDASCRRRRGRRPW